MWIIDVFRWHTCQAQKENHIIDDVSALSDRTTRRDFEGGDNSRCGEISRKYDNIKFSDLVRYSC